MPQMNFSAMYNYDPCSVSRFRLQTLAVLIFATCMNALASTPNVFLMPLPAELRLGSERLELSAASSIAIRGTDDSRLRGGLARMLRRAEERSGLTFAHLPTGEYAVSEDAATATLVIDCGAPGWAVPALGEDESYALSINAKQALLKAPTVLGALRGFETLLQLLQADSSGWFLPEVEIKDQPRFPWRGLMIDVARHWQPMEVIKRNLDGMALVKLNVLHLHLTEDQGFRIESKKYPLLHELGSDGNYFTQDQMREIIAYAAARGIRVVPEFDIPGHATSWVVGYPELASAPGPYVIERHWGVFDPVLDPTNPGVYELLDGFLSEMALLFPDPYIHIGGDENNGVHWNANAKIQAYIQKNNLKDNAGLHAYFNTRVHAILSKNKKQLIGWDEILHPDLPVGSVVHSWRGPEGIAEATKRGFATILSNGYYIDLCRTGAEHYLNDPVPPGSALTPDQRKLVLGGEATMWAEWVTPETIDSRIWPRTAAIAERLWSPQETRDVTDMYQRLAVVSSRLEETGLRHESYIDVALRRLAGDGASPADLEALRVFVDLLEPVKGYRRGEQQPGAGQHTPLTGLVDCSRPDSAAARNLANQIEASVFAKTAIDTCNASIVKQLSEWKTVATNLAAGLAVQSTRLHESVPLLQGLIQACEVGQDAILVLSSGRAPAAGWSQVQLAKLDKAALAHAAAELPMISALKLLVIAATEQEKREKMTDDAWEQYLRAIVAPPAKAAAH